jgi:tetratricopeptide (TPR) repeat protein
MEENKFLDPCDQPSKRRNPLTKKKTVFLFLIFAFTSLLLFSNCSSFRIIVLKDPLTPEEHLNLGVAYERNGEFDQAIKEYKSASKKLPIAYLYLGNVHFQKNEFQKSESYYKKAIKKGPQNADAYNNLAWLYCTQQKNLDEGEMFALKAIELNPEKDHIYRDTLEKIRELRRLRQ